MRVSSKTIAVVAALTLWPLVCLAQVPPTTPPYAVGDVHFGQTMYLYVDDTQTEKWYHYLGRAGRSYCAEVGADHIANVFGDPTVAVYWLAGTLIVQNDDADTEPLSTRGARACFISPTASFRVKVSDISAGLRSYTMRVVETTMWASWFFIGGDYSSFVLLRNTTDVAINYTVTWRSPAGAPIGTTSATVPPHGAIALNARTYVNLADGTSGSVEVAHTGSPEALVGQVTSLSGTTGLNFDSPMQQRRAW